MNDKEDLIRRYLLQQLAEARAEVFLFRHGINPDEHPLLMHLLKRYFGPREDRVKS